MTMTFVDLTQEQHHDILEHLFSGEDEQVVFAFASWNAAEGDGTFRVTEIDLIPPSDFEFQSTYHIELLHETHARLIKAAFDRHASLVEFHSHRSSRPAQFSPSDIDGFAEFVPHVRWRLQSRPYAAVVWGEGSFDGLFWGSSHAAQLDGIRVAGTILKPTRRTVKRFWGKR